MHTVFRSLLISLVIAVTAGVSSAQEGTEHLSPFSHGAGRTYVVTARGLDALGLNPASLAYGSRSSFEFSILPFSTFGAEVGAGFFFDSLTIILDSADLAEGDQDSAAFILDNEGFSGRADARLLGAYYFDEALGGFGLSWNTHAAARASLPRRLIELLTDYTLVLDDLINIENIDAQALWYNSIGVSYGRKLFGDSLGTIRSFNVGASIKYLQGIAYLRIEEGAYFRSRPEGNGGIEYEANYVMRTAHIDAFGSNGPDLGISDALSGGAGSGLGFDLGMSVAFGGTEKKPAMLLGLSINDIGSITWNRNTYERTVDHLRDTIATSGQTSESLADTLGALGGTLRKVGDFSTDLPTTIRLGGLIDLSAMVSASDINFSVALELMHGLTGTVGTHAEPRIGVGAALELPSPVASFRGATGFVVDRGVFDLTLGLGTSLFETVSFDIATARLLELFGGGNNRADVSAGFKIHL